MIPGTGKSLDSALVGSGSFGDSTGMIVDVEFSNTSRFLEWAKDEKYVAVFVDGPWDAAFAYPATNTYQIAFRKGQRAVQMCIRGRYLDYPGNTNPSHYQLVSYDQLLTLAKTMAERMP